MAQNKSMTNKTTTKTTKPTISWPTGMPFDRINYILMLVGIVVLFIGYILLSGGKSEDPAAFSEEIFNKRRMVVAPIVLTVGFIIEFFAIMLKFNKKEETKNDN